MLPRARPRDTSVEVMRRYLAALDAAGPERCAAMVFDSSEATRRLCAEGVRARHPEYNDDQIRLAVVRILLGEKLFAQVHPGVRIVP